MSSENEPERVTNAYDVEELQPPTLSVDNDTEVPSDRHTGETKTEGVDSMMEDLSNLNEEESTDDSLSASERHNLKHNDDWLGVQLTKLGELSLARRAFRGLMNENEKEEVALKRIYNNQYNAELDLAPSEPGAVDLEPVPVDESVVLECQQSVSVEYEQT